MRHTIIVFTVLLALVAARNTLSLITALGVDGVLPIFIPQIMVLALSIAGLIFWQRKDRYGTHLLLAAWAIALAVGISASFKEGFISLQALVGVPIIIMLALSFRRGNTNGSST